MTVFCDEAHGRPIIYLIIQLLKRPYSSLSPTRSSPYMVDASNKLYSDSKKMLHNLQSELNHELRIKEKCFHNYVAIKIVLKNLHELGLGLG